MKHEQNYRPLDPTKIGITTDAIGYLEKSSMDRTNMSFPDLATNSPYEAYSLIRDIYEAQPHEKPTMPEAGFVAKIDVYSITRHTGIRGLIRAIRSKPIEEASHYTTLEFGGNNGGHFMPIRPTGTAMIIEFPSSVHVDSQQYKSAA